MFEYESVIERVVDGDTFVVMLDLGFSCFRRERVRLLEVNAPELKTPDGERIAAFARENFQGKQCVINTHRDRQDKYGRYLAEVHIGKVNVNLVLRRAIARARVRAMRAAQS